MKTHEKPVHDFITLGYLGGPLGDLTSSSLGRNGDHVKVIVTQVLSGREKKKKA